MLVMVNGTERTLSDGTTVQELVQSLGAPVDGRGVAVALSGEVVPRSRWPETELFAQAHVEVLIAIQGG